MYGMDDTACDDLPRGVLIGTVDLWDCTGTEGDFQLARPRPPVSEETAKAEKPPATELVQSVLMVTPMDDRCLNVLQQKLADRIDALTSHELISVPRAIKRFLAFLDQSPLLGAALDELVTRDPQIG